MLCNFLIENDAAKWELRPAREPLHKALSRVIVQHLKCCAFLTKKHQLLTGDSWCINGKVMPLLRLIFDLCRASLDKSLSRMNGK